MNIVNLNNMITSWRRGAKVQSYSLNIFFSAPLRPCARYFLLAFLVLLSTPAAHADFYKKWGYVQARGQVLGPNNQPILVEVITDADGKPLSEVEIGEVYGPLKGVFTMSADAYRTAVAQYQQLIETQPNAVRGAVIVSTYKGEGAQASEYESYCRGLPPVNVPAPTPDAQPVGKPIPCPPVDDTAVRSVVLRHPSTVLDPDLLGEDGPILLKSPIDLRDRETLDPTIKTVLLTPAGRIARQAQGGGRYENTVTYKWNYFQPDAEGNQPALYDFTDDTGERVLNPLQGVKISHTPGLDFGDISNDQGAYRLSYYLPPCPCFTHDYSGKILGEVPYKNFNPKSRADNPFGTYTVYSQTFDFCNGMALCPLYPPSLLSNIAGIFATQATPRQPRQDLKVDAVMLTGEGIIDVPVADTAYDRTRADVDVQNPGDRLAYDFDGDRRPDRAVLYDNEYYVYLGGRSPELDENNRPIHEDLRRRPDRLPDFEDRGLLKSIGLADLEQTDLYVFRAATGQLILERLGLKQDEVVAFNDLGADSQSTASAHFFYRFLIRGPRGTADLQTGTLSDWWSKAGLELKLFDQNQADFLRTGERVQIVAINRPTGYIGSVTAPLQLNNEQDGRTTLDVPLDQLRLGPPNLKIKAERTTETQLGLTQGEINQYLIGSEGAGLTSDTYIKITTEWLNADGTPLPEALPGYSALLAKIVSPGVVAVDGTCGSQADKIEVQPGVNLQLLKLNTECDLGKEHYYLYVCGNNLTDTEGQADCFNFGTRPDGRPSRYVPVKVPVYDEIATRKLENTYRYARQDDLLSEDANAPEPVYRWVYRPEMQFSVFELAMKAINRPDPETEQAINLLTGQGTIGPQTDYVQLLFDLIAPSLPPLQAFGPAPELVFSIGGAETKVTFGQNGQVRFDDLSHLAKLTAEDYVTLQLYQNSDAGNILWEWQTAPIYLEKLDSEYPDVALAWDTYYPALGDKLITVRSELNAEELEGRQVRAEIVSAPGEPGEAGLLVNNKPEKTATATFFQRGGQYKAQFKLSGRNLTPGAASNNPIKVRFTLLSADGTSDEASIEQDWRVKNNSNTTLDEVLKGEGVFVYDSDTTAFKQEDHIGVSDGQVRKFDYVQGLLNQVIPRKRSVTPAMYSYIEEDGIYYSGTEKAVRLFKEQFKLDNTAMAPRQNSFKKLMKDYDHQSQITFWKDKILDRETLVGVQKRTTDVAVAGENDAVNSSDAGLYELYSNVVAPFIDAMITEADRYRTQASDDWVSHEGYGPTVHGHSMSYCFGCKSKLEEFNSQVVNCPIPSETTLSQLEAANKLPKTDLNWKAAYRGNIQKTQSNCTIGGGTGRLTALLDTEYDKRNTIEAYKPIDYWAGIDCAGLMQRALDAARDNKGVSIKVPRLVNPKIHSVFSETLYSDSAYTYYVQMATPDKAVKFLRKGDWIGYSHHISMMYSEKPDAQQHYQIIHAFGPGHDVYDHDGDPLTDPIFGRMVIVTRNSIKAAKGYARLRLWD